MSALASIVMIIVFAAVIWEGEKRRKREFDRTEGYTAQPKQEEGYTVRPEQETINNNNQARVSRIGASANYNGAVLYAPETCYNGYKVQLTVSVVIVIVSVSLAFFFAMFRDMGSWKFRNFMDEMFPVAPIAFVAVSLFFGFNADVLKKALPILATQKISITPRELTAHNGKIFVSAYLDEIVEVRAEYRKPNLRAGRFNAGVLIISTSDQTIEFYCFKSAVTVASAINAILIQQLR